MSWLEVEDGVRLRFSDRCPDIEIHAPVLLVHGWKQSHRLYDRLALALLRRGHRVVSYDQRGMGESDKPDGPYDFDVFASDLEQVIKAVGSDDLTLFGWSMGCTVSLEYLHRRPLGAARVVLHNGPLRLTQAPDFPYAMPSSQFEGYRNAMELAWPSSEREFLAESVLNPGDDGLLELLLAIALQTPLDIALKAVRSQAALDHRSVVECLQIPVLALYSDKDPYYPVALAAWIAESATDGEFAVLHSSAHCAPLEEPETLANLVSEFAVRTGPTNGSIVVGSTLQG